MLNNWMWHRYYKIKINIRGTLLKNCVFENNYLENLDQGESAKKGRAHISCAQNRRYA